VEKAHAPQAQFGQQQQTPLPIKREKSLGAFGWACAVFFTLIIGGMLIFFALNQGQSVPITVPALETDADDTSTQTEPTPWYEDEPYLSEVEVSIGIAPPVPPTSVDAPTPMLDSTPNSSPVQTPMPESTETAIRLSAPVVTINGSLISWYPIAGADIYDVFVNGAFFALTHQTQFDLRSISLPVEIDCSIHVVPSNAARTSEADWSNEVIYGLARFTQSHWEYAVSDGNAIIVGYMGNSGAVVIPTTLGGYPVTKIGYDAFGWGKTVLTSISIPNSVTTIGMYAFIHASFASVDIPNSVKHIGEGAFRYCHRLDNVIIPSSVTTIDRLAFWQCSSLENITIPSSVTSIGYEAFGDIHNLTIHCSPNSAAHRYAVDNGINFSFIP
jgi:hypothetical protein